MKLKDQEFGRLEKVISVLKNTRGLRHQLSFILISEILARCIFSKHWIGLDWCSVQVQPHTMIFTIFYMILKLILMWFSYVYETKLNSTLSINANILKLEPLVDWIERVDSIGKLPYGFLEKQISYTNTDYPLLEKRQPPKLAKMILCWQSIVV